MFKKVIITFVLAITPLFAAEIAWEKDYEIAVAKAKKEKKPIFFYISKTTCPPCIKLKKTTFKNKDVIEKLNKEFIPAVVYTDKGGIPPRHLYVPYTPSLWFLKSDGEPRYEPLIGAVDAGSFLRALDIVIEDFKSQK